MDEEFNLEALRVISDAISAPSGANNEAPMNNINNASSDVATCSTYSKKGRGARSKSSKKASQENVVVQSQPSLQVLTTPQDVILTPVEYVPHQHVNNAPNHNTNVVFQANPQNNVAPFQPRPLVSAAPCCSPITGVQMAEMMFASKSSDDNRNRAAKPNYLNQCKNRLRKYQSDAMRDFSDILYSPIANETSFESLEGADMEFVFRKKVFECMDTLNKHSHAVWELEKAMYSCVLPLKEKVGGVFPDSHNFNSVTPTRINNAFKRKRQEQLETLRDNAISLEVVEQLRPPKSYCLKQWPSRPAGEQFEKLQPLFEAFNLMRRDLDLKLHTYLWVQTLEQFKGLLFSLKEREPKYYEELTRYLVTAGKTRVRWYKDLLNGKIDEITYVELCKKQNRQKAPHDILRLV